LLEGDTALILVARSFRFWVLIAWKDEVLKLVLSSPEVADDTAIITGPLSAIASAALAIAGALSVVGSFGISLEPVSFFFTSFFCTITC